MRHVRGPAHIEAARGAYVAWVSPRDDDPIAQNLVQFLRSNLVEGQEAQIAIHPELRRVMVFVDDELVLACSFDDLLAGPGASVN
jgi:hypothetical protein